MSDAVTKSLMYELETVIVEGSGDGLEYFQEDYFQDDYFQGNLIYFSGNLNKSTASLNYERTTVLL